MTWVLFWAKETCYFTPSLILVQVFHLALLWRYLAGWARNGDGAIICKGFGFGYEVKQVIKEDVPHQGTHCAALRDASLYIVEGSVYH